MKKIILPEIISIGIYNAQVVFKNKSVSPNRKTTMFEIELPIGNGGISYMDGISHPISENIVICAKPGQLRHTILPFMCYYVHMIVNEGSIFDILSSLPNYMELSDTEDIKELFTSMYEHYTTGTSKEDILLQSLILKLVYLLDQKASASSEKYHPGHNNREVIEQTIKYIKENLSENLSLTSLAERINFSPIYFHKLFKASTGMTLHEYIENQRIKRSADLLISTSMTLSQIAYECGFSSQSYFSYAFERNMGMTPRAYAKKTVEHYNDIKSISDP